MSFCVPLTVQQVEGKRQAMWKVNANHSYLQTMDPKLQKSAVLENKLMKKSLSLAVNKLDVDVLNKNDLKKQ